MAARVMILLLLGAAKGCWSIVEQPQSSIMELHPTFQRTLKMLRMFKLGVRLQDFGGATPKPLNLYSSNSATIICRYQRGW